MNQNLVTYIYYIEKTDEYKPTKKRISTRQKNQTTKRRDSDSTIEGKLYLMLYRSGF